jgi:hypothetical protein
MDQVAREMVLVALVEVKISQVVVGNVLGKHVIDRHQRSYGLWPPRRAYTRAGLETVKLVLQVGAFGFGCRVGSLD